MGVAFNFNKGEIEWSSGGGGTDPYITHGTNGITYIRRETPGTGELWDEYIDSTGHLVTITPSGAGTTDIPMGLLFLSNLA